MLLLAALAVAVPIAIHLREQRRKGLAVALVTNRSLVTGSSRFPLAVAYGGEELSHPRLMVFAIGNIGNVAIRAEDFETPLVVAIGAGRLLAADVTRTRPPDLDAAVSHSGADIDLSPRLMNPGDVVEVQCLVDGRVASEDVTVRGRVVGVSAVPLLSVQRTSWGEPWRHHWVEDAVAIAAAFGLGAAFVAAAWTWPPSLRTFVVTGIAAVLIAAFTRHVLRQGHRSRLFIGP